MATFRSVMGVNGYVSHVRCEKVLLVLVVAVLGLCFVYLRITRVDREWTFHQEKNSCVWNITIDSRSFILDVEDSKKQNIWSLMMLAFTKRMLDSAIIRVQTSCVNKTNNTASRVTMIKRNTTRIAVSKTTQKHLIHGKVTAKPTKPTKLSKAAKSTKTKKPSKPKNQKPQCKDPFFTTFQKEKRFICFGVTGGLGNWMFLYASAYGIAKKTGRKVVINKNSPLLKIFKINATKVEGCVCKGVKLKTAKLFCSFDKSMFSLPKVGNFEVKQYLQSWKYFENLTDEIKHQFTFKDAIVNKSLTILSRIKEEYKTRTNQSGNNETSQNVTFVGVHIRRGDIANKKTFIDYGYKVAPKEYIEKAMKVFESNFTNVVFVFVSNDMTWTKANVKKQDNVFFNEGSSAEVDMCLLAHCNHTIMSVGTFGWFSAFLSEGVTIYYKHHHKESSALKKQFSADYKDYFYPGWIAME